MSSLRTIGIFTAITILLAMLLEGSAWVIVGSATPDPRFACAAASKPEDFKVFSYGGSTVYGTPVPEYGFMSQLDVALRRLPAVSGRNFSVCNMGEGGRDMSGVLLDIERTLRYRPDVIVVMEGHNEFLQPVFESTSRRRWRERIAGLATIRLINKVTERNRKRNVAKTAPVQKALPARLDGFDRASPEFQMRITRFEDNVDTIIRLTGNAGIPVLFGTMPSNLDDWPPVYRRLDPQQGGVRDEAAVATVLELLLAGERAAARSRFEQLHLEGEEATAPVVRYLHAHFLPQENEQERAARASALIAARDADPLPWRAMSRFNEHVRNASVAAPHVSLIDIERLLARAAGDNLPGFDLITDNCHPTPHANRLIAAALLERIAQLVKTGATWTTDDFDEWMKALPDSLALEYLLRNGVYVMKVPFFDYAAARRYLESARQHTPDDWRSWANLASVELLTGNRSQGLAHLRQAAALQPDARLYSGPRHTPYIDAALAHAGMSFAEAVEPPATAVPGEL